MTKPEANKNYSNSDIMAALYDLKQDMNEQLSVGRQKMDNLQDQIAGNEKMGIKGIRPEQREQSITLGVMNEKVNRLQAIYLKPIDAVKGFVIKKPLLMAGLIVYIFSEIFRIGVFTALLPLLFKALKLIN